MRYEFVLVDRQEDVGVITLNRPEKLNAINHQMSAEIGEALDELNQDPAIGAVILTGAGRAFCSGADVSRFEDAIRVADGLEPLDRPRRRFNWIEQVRASKPIVCAVNGACIGAGMTRTLPCDVRIASTNALFSMRFVRVGLIPEIASTQILPQIVGLQVAADLMFSARNIDGDEAHRIGLVLKVVEPDELLPTALSLAREYAENPPNAVLETKKALYANYVEQDITLVSRREGEGLGRQRGSAEQREAVAAFREKRRPDFRKLRS
jgi:2-(1,2-epoxy-1,2-dihydrophenyl)acetyl-CoA isomerase